MKTLRQMMLQHMQLRNYSKRTIDTYLHCLTALSRFYNKPPDKSAHNRGLREARQPNRLKHYHLDGISLQRYI